MKKVVSLALVVVISGAVLMGCAPSAADDIKQVDPIISAKVSAEAMLQKNIKQDVKMIELFDIDGNPLEREYTRDWMDNMVKAFNDSVIDDTGYVKMLAGYTMVITLVDDSEVRITSYGDEEKIIATVDDVTYHLTCLEIGKILLDK